LTSLYLFSPFAYTGRYSLWTHTQGDFTPETKYGNFSAFLAELLAAGVVESTRLYPLVQGPFFGAQPPHNQPAQSQPYVLAGVQWILHAGPVLRESCDKQAIGARFFRQQWWDRWKARFGTVAKYERFSNQTRQLAAQTLERMASLEKETPGRTSIVEKLGMKVAEPDSEDEEMEEEDVDDERQC
jgi:hypothetical protein